MIAPPWSRIIILMPSFLFLVLMVVSRFTFNFPQFRGWHLAWLRVLVCYNRSASSTFFSNSISLWTTTRYMGRHNLLLKTRSFHWDHMCRIMFAAIATSDDVSFHMKANNWFVSSKWLGHLWILSLLTTQMAFVTLQFHSIWIVVSSSVVHILHLGPFFLPNYVKSK